MAENHVVIGLGGTGGKIIRSLRKMIYQTMRQTEPSHVNMRYLYVDSDASMMGIDDDSWKILGQSVQLGKESQLQIAGMNLKDILENVNDYPGIKPWIGDRDQWRGILQSAQGAKINGAQKRRLGRFLLASKLGDFRDMLSKLVNSMVMGGQNGVVFHVCAGLAGGTGSGTVIDIVTHIRHIYQDQNNRILLYLLLPDEHPHPNWAGPNYHANGYAALAELNALSVGQFAPHDLTGRHSGVDSNGHAARIEVQDPFNAAYVFTNENAAGYTVDVDRELPDIVSSFLYNKVVTVSGIGQDKVNQLRRQETYEIGAQAINGEKEFDEGAETRSRRFFSFGIKQISYPEEEIHEYLAYSFAQQAALQLRFNHWADGIGFQSEPRQQAFDTYIRNKDIQNRWRITDEHLMLSIGILQEEIENKRWKPIAQDWSTALGSYATLVKDQTKKDDEWLPKLHQMCEKRYESEYRGQGVVPFFTSRAQIKARHARQIRTIIETELFEAWTSGTQSIHELSQILADLRREIEERRKGFDTQVTRQQEVIEQSHAKLQDIRRKWSQIGPLGKVMGQHIRLWTEATAIEEIHFAARTQVQGLEFAKRLIADVLTEIDEFKGQVDEAAGRLLQAIERFEEGIAARCADEGLANTEKQVVRFYDPAAVRQLGDLFIKNADEQKTQTARIRSRLLEEVGVNPNFTRLNERLSVRHILDVFARQSADNAMIAHENLRVGSDGTAALLGVSIIDKLFERFAGNEHELNKYIYEIVGKARTYSRFDDAQKTKMGPGIPTGQAAFSTFTVILPQSEEHSEFLETLKRAFSRSMADGVDPDFVLSPHRKNEIVIMNVTSSFPLRFLHQTGFLKKRYEQRIAESDGRAALEIHTEGSSGLWPRLYPPEKGETDKRPYALLAKALGVLTEIKDRAGHVVDLQFIIKDDIGLILETVKTGVAIELMAEQLTPRQFTGLRRAVNEEIREPAWDDSERRAEAQKHIVSEANAIQGRLRNGQGAGWSEAAREAIAMLNAGGR